MARCKLDLSPRQNWIDKCGGLPPDIASVACHMLENGVVSRHVAIPAGVNFAKFVCRTGKSKNFLKGNPSHTVAPEKRARWCRAVAEWEAKKACARKLGLVPHVKAMGSLDAVDVFDEVDYALPGVEVADGTAVVANQLKAVEDHGDLIVEGYAADFTGFDRDQEIFEPGAFERGWKAFLASNPVLLYHHKPSQALGQVLGGHIDEKGLYVKARIDKPTPGSWAEDVVDKVKTEAIKGFSVGGAFFKRLGEKGMRIFDVDLQEISVTPLPVNPRTLFSLSGAGAGKAVMDGKAMDEEFQVESWRPYLSEDDQATIARLDKALLRARVARVRVQLDAAERSLSQRRLRS